MDCICLFNCSITVEMNIYRIKTLKFNLLFMTKFMLTHSSCFFLFLFAFKRKWFKQKLYLIHILKLNINRKKWSHDPVTFCLVFCFVLFFVLLMIMVLNKSSHPNNQFHSLTGRVEISACRNPWDRGNSNWASPFTHLLHLSSALPPGYDSSDQRLDYLNRRPIQTSCIGVLVPQIDTI